VLIKIPIEGEGLATRTSGNESLSATAAYLDGFAVQTKCVFCAASVVLVLACGIICKNEHKLSRTPTRDVLTVAKEIL
jgi:hypothetical protein